MMRRNELTLTWHIDQRAKTARRRNSNKGDTQYGSSQCRVNGTVYSVSQKNPTPLKFPDIFCQTVKSF